MALRNVCDICNNPCDVTAPNLVLGEEGKRVFVAVDIRLEAIPPGQVACVCDECRKSVLTQVIGGEKKSRN